MNAVQIFGIAALAAGGLFLLILVALGMTSVETYDDFWDDES